MDQLQPQDLVFGRLFLLVLLVFCDSFTLGDTSLANSADLLFLHLLMLSPPVIYIVPRLLYKIAVKIN